MFLALGRADSISDLLNPLKAAGILLIVVIQYALLLGVVAGCVMVVLGTVL